MIPRRIAAALLLLFAALLSTTSTVLATKTVIDLVSSDPGFSRLVRELQRLRLVVLLNNRKTCTFFAPTNAAFAKWDEENQGRRISKATLLYHILPSNVLTENLKDAMLLETLLVREGYLGDNGEGQLVAVTKPSWRPGRKVRLLIGEAELLEKDWQADNGVVHVLDRLLLPPGDLVETMQKHEELASIYNIVHAAGLDSLLREHRPFTLFAPSADALKKLTDIQLHYLRHDQGRQDLEITFHHHIHSGTLYRENIQPGTSSLSTLEGQDLMISLDDKLLVDNAEVEKTDILASNGVIHMVSRPLLPRALVWTAAKYLLGLNATKFVDALRDAGLSHCIDDPAASYTIFAPQDDTFDTASLTTSQATSNLLQYHVVPGRKLQSSFMDGQLLETEMYGDQLKGGSQRSKVSVRPDNKQASISINGVEVKGEPVQVGKSLIYLLSRPLTLPLPVLESMKQEETLSGFVQALSASGLDHGLSDARGITVFAPSTSAWDELGVVTDYLFLNDNSSLNALQAVTRYAVVENIHYTPDIKPGRTVLKTSEGSDLVVEKSTSAIYVGEGRLERSEQVGGKISVKDMLVASGVVHKVSSVALPPTLSITLFNVLQGAGAQTFLQAFKTSNITRILTDWEQDYTIFAPTDEAFQKADLQGALNDLDFVARLVRLHVIPGKVLKLEEDINDDEPSMLNADARLSLRDIHRDGKSFGVRVKGARSKKEAKIVGIGRAHPAWPTEEDGSDYHLSRKEAMSRQFRAVTDRDTLPRTPFKSAPRPGGVIFVIDRVLLPGDLEALNPAWFWMGVVLVALIGTIVLCALTAISVNALIKEIRHLEGYDVVPTQEETDRPGEGEGHAPAEAALATTTEPVANIAASPEEGEEANAAH